MEKDNGLVWKDLKRLWPQMPTALDDWVSRDQESRDKGK